MQIPNDSIILTFPKFLEALSSDTLTPDAALDWNNTFNAKRIDCLRMLHEIPYNVRKSKTNDRIRCLKLEYKIYSCLQLLARYRLAIMKRDTQKTFSEILVQAWKNLLPHIKYNKDHINPEERILLQTMRMFTLAHLGHTLILAEASPSDILSCCLQLCCELQNYKNLLLSEKFSALENKTFQTFTHAAHLSQAWNVALSKAMTKLMLHIQHHTAHYSETDRKFLTYFNDSTKENAEPNPAEQAEKLLKENYKQMGSQLRNNIARCILNPQDKTIPDSVRQTAYYAGMLFFLRLQLAHTIYLRNRTLSKPKLSQEEQKRVEEQDERNIRVYMALYDITNTFLPLLNMYRYFLRAPYESFPFLSVIPMGASIWFANPGRLEQLHQNDETERHFTFALLAEVGSLSREAINKMIKRWIREFDVGQFPFSKQLLFAYVSEETDTKDFPKMDKRPRVGDPLLLETFELFRVLSGKHEECFKIEKCRHYFCGMAAKLSRVNSDFIVTATFLLLCKKALLLSDKAFTDEIHKIVQAYVESKPSVAVFPPQEYQEEPKKIRVKQKSPQPKNATTKKGNTTAVPPKPNTAMAKKTLAPPPPKPAAVTAPSKKREFTDVPFEYYPKPLRVKKEVRKSDIPHPTAQTGIVVSTDAAAPQRARAKQFPVSLPTYLSWCAARFPRLVRVFKNLHEFNCKELDDILCFFNRRATHQTNFKFATPLYGSTLLGRNSDFDLMVHAPLEEVRALLETTRFDHEIITPIKVITGKHPHLRVMFKHNPTLRIDISAFPELCGEELPIPFLRLLVLTQRQLNPEPTGLFFFHCGSQQFLIDSTYFLATLKQTPYALRLNPLTDETPKVVVGITFNVIKFLAKYGDDFKPTPEVVALFEKAKKFFSTAVVYDPFVKLLYNGWTRRSLKRLIEFGLLQILCNPLATHFRESKDFRRDIRRMDETHSRQYQLQAEASQVGYETVRLFMVAYYLFPLQRVIQLETLPFKLTPIEIGGIHHYWSFWRQQANAPRRKIEMPPAEGAALRKSK